MAFVNHNLTVAAEIDALLKPARKKRGSPERDAQVAVVKCLKTILPPGTVIAAVKNEHAASGKTVQQRMRFGQKRKAEGVCPGFPDLICLIPGGLVLLVEMKSAVGDLSPAQTDLHAHLLSIGFRVFVVRDVLEAAEAVKAAGFGLRRSRLDGAA